MGEKMTIDRPKMKIRGKKGKKRRLERLLSLYPKLYELECKRWEEMLADKENFIQFDRFCDHRQSNR
jgi:hypothetical protein